MVPDRGSLQVAQTFDMHACSSLLPEYFGPWIFQARVKFKTHVLILWSFHG